MIQGTNLTVVGVSLFDLPHLEPVHLQLDSGVTALYGLNGAGKTTVLKEIERVLTGVERANGLSALHVKIDDRLANNPPEQGSFLDHLHDALALGRPDGHGLVLWTLIDRIVAQSRGASLKRDGEPREHFWDEDVFYEQDDLLLTLVPSGSEAVPQWDVYLSITMDDEIRRRAEELVNRRYFYPFAEIVEGRVGTFSRPTHLPWLHESADDFWRFIPVPAFDMKEDEPLRLAPPISPAVRSPTGWPVPVQLLGSIAHGPVTLVTGAEPTDQLNTLTQELFARSRGGKNAWSIVEIAQDGDVVLAPWARELCDTLTTTAQQQLDRMFPGTAGLTPRLSLQLRGPSDWFIGRCPHWTATAGNGSNLDLDQLSNAQLRWSALAIRMAIAAHEQPDVTMVVLDEPEAGLHRTAEHSLTGALRALAAKRSVAVLAATHSPALLRPAETGLMHVHRDPSGATVVTPFEANWNGRLTDLEPDGLRPADLLSLMRVAVCVEGEHDQIVLQHVLGHVLREGYCRILPMRGAKNAPVLPDAQLLFDATDAHIVVVLDNVAAQAVVPIWETATRLARERNPAVAHTELRKLESLSSGEGRWLHEMGGRAIETGHMGRITPLPLSRRDIIFYLDVAQFVPTAAASTWEDLHREWHSQGRRGENFKDYLRRTRGAQINKRTIEKAVSQISAESQTEFQQLAETLRRLAFTTDAYAL